MDHNDLDEWFKNESPKNYTEKDVWDFNRKASEGKIEYHESGLGMKYIVDNDGYIVCFVYDEINLFVIDKEGFLRWCSPASSLDDEPVKYSNEIVLSFLISNEFEVFDSKGFIKAKAPMGL